MSPSLSIAFIEARYRISFWRIRFFGACFLRFGLSLTTKQTGHLSDERQRKDSKADETKNREKEDEQKAKNAETTIKFRRKEEYKVKTHKRRKIQNIVVCVFFFILFFVVFNSLNNRIENVKKPG